MAELDCSSRLAPAAPSRRAKNLLFPSQWPDSARRLNLHPYRKNREQKQLPRRQEGGTYKLPDTAGKSWTRGKTWASLDGGSCCSHPVTCWLSYPTDGRSERVPCCEVSPFPCSTPHPTQRALQLVLMLARGGQAGAGDCCWEQPLCAQAALSAVFELPLCCHRLLWCALRIINSNNT